MSYRLTAGDGDDTGQGYAGASSRPSHQSVRPAVADIARLHDLLADVTEEEVGRMSVLAQELAGAAGEVAAAHGVSTVTADDPSWADPSTMADDDIHPNGAGYAQLTTRSVQAFESLLEEPGPLMSRAAPTRRGGAPAGRAVGRPEQGARRRGAREVAAGVGGPAGAVLQFQRSIGNQATRRLLAAHPSPAPIGGGHFKIQRAG